jgi:glycosyltransferase involved in cell wall biosynthesis
VSVVIPVFNGGQFVGQAILSVLKQTWRDLEVIVVDDGSTDETPSVVGEFGDRILYLRQERQGVSVARNAGIRAARGEYLAFLDADDVWLPQKLQRQIECLNDNPDVGAVGCGHYVVDRELNILEKKIPSCWQSPLEDLLLFRSNWGLFSSTLLVRRSVIERVGGFDPSLSTSADWDLAIRIARQCGVTFVGEPLVYYRQHGANMHLNVRLMERDMRVVLRKAFAMSGEQEFASLRRRAYGGLFRVLAGSYWHSGDVLSAIRCLLLSIAWHPANLVLILCSWGISRSYFRKKLLEKTE